MLQLQHSQEPMDNTGEMWRKTSESGLAFAKALTQHPTPERGIYHDNMLILRNFQWRRGSKSFADHEADAMREQTSAANRQHQFDRAESQKCCIAARQVGLRKARLSPTC